MLFNRSTGKPRTDADILSLDSLIAWLEQQPATDTYHYCSSERCLLARYFTAMGWHGVSITPSSYIKDHRYQSLPDGWNHIALGHCTPDRVHWTFGEALARAREFQKASWK